MSDTTIPEHLLDVPIGSWAFIEYSFNQYYDFGILGGFEWRLIGLKVCRKTLLECLKDYVEEDFDSNLERLYSEISSLKSSEIEIKVPENEFILVDLGNRSNTALPEYLLLDALDKNSKCLSYVGLALDFQLSLPYKPTIDQFNYDLKRLYEWYLKGAEETKRWIDLVRDEGLIREERGGWEHEFVFFKHIWFKGSLSVKQVVGYLRKLANKYQKRKIYVGGIEQLE